LCVANKLQPAYATNNEVIQTEIVRVEQTGVTQCTYNYNRIDAEFDSEQ